MIARFHVMGADRAGSWTLRETDDLGAAIAKLDEMRASEIAHGCDRSAIFFICDYERDGAMLSDEEIDEARS